MSGYLIPSVQTTFQCEMPRVFFDLRPTRGACVKESTKRGEKMGGRGGVVNQIHQSYFKKNTQDSE